MSGVITVERLTTALADRYRVERELGTGGMATVYLAHDLKHERDVAIKVLHPDLGAALGAERFLAEIKTTAKLQHPHILPLLDSGAADGLLYYVMPYVRGETLRARLDRERQLPIADAVLIAREVADALHAAHALGIVHRDIKPENILLQDGHALVADFGIALAVQTAGGARMTQTGLSLGTPSYMSPEQAMGERTVDARSDIYALGAVTYEMLTGEPPFSGNSVQAIVAKVLSSEPEPIATIRKSVSPAVMSTVHAALQKLPADRPATARAFAERLVTVSADTVAGLTTSVAGRATVGHRKWRVAALVFGAAAAVSTFVAGWASQRPTPTMPTTRYVMSMDTTERLGGSGTRIAMSPDGATLVYTNGRDRRIWVRRRESLQGRPLEGTEGAYSPFFSPDGLSVGYVDAERRLRLVTIEGARITQVTDTLVGLAGSVWSKAGMIYSDAAGSTGLVQVGARVGARPRMFTTTDTSAGEVNHAWPEMLPDGESLLFQIRYSTDDGELRHAIGIADVATGKHHKLCDGAFARVIDNDRLLVVTEQGDVSVVPFDARKKRVTGPPTMLGVTVYLQSSRGADIAVSNSGRLAYVAGTGSTTSELLWRDASGRRKPVDSAWHENFANPRVSRDGSRLAVTVGSKGREDVWIKPLPNGTPYRLTLDAALNFAPTWGPDAASVTYISQPTATAPTEVRVKPADGSTGERMVPLPRGHHAAEVNWSPDGQWLVYRTVGYQGKNNERYTDIYAFRPGVDTAPRALEAKSALRGSPVVSPDGRYLAYVSAQSETWEVFVVPFPDVTRTRWLVGVGTDIRWTPDGRFLLWRQGGALIRQAEIRLGDDFAVLKQDVWGGNAGVGATFLGSNRIFDAAPNGELLTALPIEDDGTAKLIVVENWLAELNKRTGGKP